jgi:histidyl-tRNA synthetase
LLQLAKVLDRNAAGDAALAELTAIDAVLTKLGVPDAAARIDPAIVRGLEYYTGAVFEAQLAGAGGKSFGSVGGGGRYDDLVSRFRGQPIPATGFSVGVSRLAAALSAQRDDVERGPVVVLVLDQQEIADSFVLAAQLRAAGIAAEVYLGASGMKAQMKYADRRNAPVAVIVGENERANSTVSLKNLRVGAALGAQAADREAYARAQGQAQIETPRREMVDAVRRMISGTD